MEKMINNRIKWYLDKHTFLPKHQTGFRRGCTTSDNLIQLEAAIKSGFNQNHTTTAIFLDLAKAYDDTWITGLLYKIAKLKIRGTTLKWLNNFLTDRSINVKVENAISNTRTLHKGVPQGSVLSPLLFNIMMSDIPQPGPRDKLSLFADDIAIYTTTPSKPEAQPILQRYLNKIEHWATTWKFKFSVPKCAIITFSRKRSNETDPVIYLNGTRITPVNQYKYLGIILDSKLNWEAHTNHTLHSINRKANLLKLLTSGKSTLNTGLLIRIYKALIRSKIDYGSIVLSSMNKSKLLKLEQTQNTILRNILGCLKSTPTALIYIESGLTPIKHRWDLLSSRYLMKLNERPGNPAYTTLHNLTLNSTGWKLRSTPAVIPHLKMIQTNTEEAFNTAPSEIPWIEPLPPWQLFEIKTQLLPT
jgi:hypothetical protein